MLRSVVVLAFAVGCNQLYDLEPTRAAEQAEPAADLDGDGVRNSDDNCMMVANADQTDGDADGFGDVCDVCPADDSTQHDEDGDGKGDPCDVCPGQSDTDQLDRDADGVGDLCEHLNEEGEVGTPDSKLVLFDAFEVLGAAWRTSGATWQAVDGAVVTAAAPGDPGLRHTSFQIPSAAFVIEIRVGFTRDLVDGDRLGIGVVSAQGEELTRCEIRCAGGTCGVGFFPCTGIQCNVDVFTSPGTGATRRLRLTNVANMLECQLLLDNLASDKQQSAIAGTGLVPVLYGSPAARITHFAAWTH